MIRDGTSSRAARGPNEPLGEDCAHKVTEDCLICAVCGRCREDLDEDDVCTECGSLEKTLLQPIAASSFS